MILLLKGMSFLCTHLLTTYWIPTTGIIVIYTVFKLMFLWWPCSVITGGFLVLTLVSWFAVWSCRRSHWWSGMRILITFSCTVFFFLLKSNASLSGSWLDPFPSIRMSAFVFLTAFRAQTLHFMNLHKEVTAATQVTCSALRLFEEFWNQERVVKQSRMWYSYQHGAHPAVHITQDCVRRQNHFHLKHSPVENGRGSGLEV